jgi:hypothetical protein
MLKKKKKNKKNKRTYQVLLYDPHIACIYIDTRRDGVRHFNRREPNIRLISSKEYKMIAIYIIIIYTNFTYNYSDSGMTSSSWFRRFVGILTLIFLGPAGVKGLGGIVNLSTSPSNI